MRALLELVLAGLLLAGSTPTPPAAVRAGPVRAPATPAEAATGPADRTALAADRLRPGVGTWPLEPRPTVLSTFEPPTTPWGPGHRGVDLAGRVGQPVRAALPGRVSHAGRLAGRGVVVVDHGRTRTTYEPVVADVALGTRVSAGQHLGRLELAGSHCLPAACLHWGWRRGEAYLDPLRLVGARPVRLFPPRPGPGLPAGHPTGSWPAGSWPAGSWAAAWPQVTPAGAPGGTPPGVGHW